MINLIPNEEKKKMANNFYYRLAILSFIMLGMCAVFSILTLLPSYVAVRAMDDFAEVSLRTQAQEPVPELDQATLAFIEDTDTKLSLIESLQRDRFSVADDVVGEVIDSQTGGIRITKISYDVGTPEDGGRVGIAGTAFSRESLLSFRRALENNTSFRQVDLPISNFVRGSNIPFFLTLSPNAGAKVYKND